MQRKTWENKEQEKTRSLSWLHARPNELPKSLYSLLIESLLKHERKKQLVVMK